MKRCMTVIEWLIHANGDLQCWENFNESVAQQLYRPMKLKRPSSLSREVTRTCFLSLNFCNCSGASCQIKEFYWVLIRDIRNNQNIQINPPPSPCSASTVFLFGNSENSVLINHRFGIHIIKLLIDRERG